MHHICFESAEDDEMNYAWGEEGLGVHRHRYKVIRQGTGDRNFQV